VSPVGEVLVCTFLGWIAGAVWWGARQIARLTRAAERYLRVLEAVVQDATRVPPPRRPPGQDDGDGHASR
jgi:hypothetical protein